MKPFILVLALVAFSAAPAFATAVDRAQDDLDDAKKAEKELAKLLQKCRLDHAGANPSATKTACQDLEDQDASAKDDVKSAKKKLDRLQDAAENADRKGPNGNTDCVECNKDKAKYQGKNGWESFADVIKAVTPLGLGAMNTYAGVKATETASSDYNTYASAMASNGLPFSQNTTNYGNIMGSVYSGNNMLSMLSMMQNGSLSSFGAASGMGGYGSLGLNMGFSLGSMGGYGMSGLGMGGMSGMTGMYGLSGYGGMGYGVMSPYGYASSGGYGGLGYNGYAGYSGYGYGQSGYGLSYNPYNTSYLSSSSYGSLGSYYGAQLRQYEQSAITSQDAAAAQQALYTAQTRYSQVLGNIGYSYSSYPYSSYYGGSTSYYYPYTSSYSTGTSGVPTLNSVRQ